MSIKKIAILGLGSIGKRHLRLARLLYPEAEIRVMRYSDTAKIPEFADGCVADLSAALAFRPDLAVIATPAPFHVNLAIPLAEAGVNLLIEKPIAANLMGLERLLEAIERCQITALVGYNLRFLPSLRVFREQLLNNVVGHLWTVRAEVGLYLPLWRSGNDYRKWVSSKLALGGGVLLELSHEVDYLRWIFGEVSWVQAAISRQSNLDIDVEDCAYLVMGFGLDNLSARLDLDFIRHDSTRQCLVIGERGTLRWNGLAGTVDFFSAEQKSWCNVCELPVESDESYLEQWRHLADCINTDSPPLVSAFDARKTLAVIEAAKRSGQLDGCRVFVDKSGVS
jgi:predicted dehydrogenase